MNPIVPFNKQLRVHSVRIENKILVGGHLNRCANFCSEMQQIARQLTETKQCCADEFSRQGVTRNVITMHNIAHNKPAKRTQATKTPEPPLRDSRVLCEPGKSGAEFSASNFYQTQQSDTQQVEAARFRRGGHVIGN